MRLSTSLFAMCVALSAMTATPVIAADTVGSWKIGPQTDSEIKASCIMEMMANPATSIFAVVDGAGDLQIGVRKRDRFDFLPTEDPDVELSFDGQSAARHGSSLLTAEVVLTSTPYGASEPDQLEGALRSSRTLQVQARGVSASVVMLETAAALDALRLCEAQADGQASVAHALSPTNNLSNAMRGVVGTTPKVAEFKCEVTGRVLSGLIDPSGNNRTQLITIGIANDGSGFLNGSTLPPAQVERSDGGELAASAFPFEAVYAAMLGDADPYAGYGSFTHGDDASRKAFAGIVNGMMGAAMGGRQRFMVVSLAQSSVVFFDLTSSGGTANRSAPDCIRTM